jgi:predicted Zn-dependent protease
VAHDAMLEFPQSRSIAYRYADALQHAGRHDDAIAFLRDQIEQYRHEPALYQLIARSYQAQDKGLLEHQALAEEYYLKGSVKEAIEQLNLAKRTNDGDFYAQSEIDARMRALKDEWADLQKDRKNGTSPSPGVVTQQPVQRTPTPFPGAG